MTLENIKTSFYDDFMTENVILTTADIFMTKNVRNHHFNY